MARPGQELTNPVTGESLRFVRTTAETGGELLEVEASWTGDGPRPPAHLHPRQEERFQVLEGTLEAELGEERRTFRAGDSFTVPPGTVHRMWARKGEGARARWETRPALGTERFFESIWGLAADGEVDRRTGGPSPLRAAPIALRHAGEFRLAKPPWPVQRAALAVLAPIARLRGYGDAYDAAAGR